MTILLFLIPISLIMIGAAALIFVWAVRHGQFEDLDTPALDVLRDDDPAPKQHNTAATPTEKPDAD
ncbi:MAG: cbb3-type cytochrome oxidase assembly protein CcoS [Thermomonas sp.]|uniref:cbb3-type cytochrome oxidase assembly protein CcoS n=1 Tax=Thermomonas sp. TaxID=1971895 RepID=UPI001EBB619A|nr:cbb3-type cytochrome oxidase assembly protein CcoS [Thermomonas sp.]MBV2209224.1 cbb3-type cytochrome oxidase assembly protein CcoS [Thermomonas sp.]